MKLCGACLEEFDKEAFSTKQWKLNQHQRRCKQCVEEGRESQLERPAETERGNGGHVPKFPISDENGKRSVREAIDAAVKMIMSRGIPPNVGLDGFNERKLAKRLWNVSPKYFSLGGIS
jgi:hypothetical protein